MGTVRLPHPLRLRAMIVRRSKTDRLDAQLLANLLWLNQIPLSCVPSEDYELLCDVVRYRTTMSRQVPQAKSHSRQLLARQNVHASYAARSGHAGCTGSAARTSARWGTGYGTMRWNGWSGRENSWLRWTSRWRGSRGSSRRRAC